MQLGLKILARVENVSLGILVMHAKFDLSLAKQSFLSVFSFLSVYSFLSIFNYEVDI